MVVGSNAGKLKMALHCKRLLERCWSGGERRRGGPESDLQVAEATTRALVGASPSLFHPPTGMVVARADVLRLLRCRMLRPWPSGSRCGLIRSRGRISRRPRYDDRFRPARRLCRVSKAMKTKYMVSIIDQLLVRNLVLYFLWRGKKAGVHFHRPSLTVENARNALRNY